MLSLIKTTKGFSGMVDQKESQSRDREQTGGAGRTSKHAGGSDDELDMSTQRANQMQYRC